MKPDSAIDSRAGGPSKPIPTNKNCSMKSLKKRQVLDATVVCINQTPASVQIEPRKAWLPKGPRPAVELSGQRDWTCMLGAITEDGGAFFSQTNKNITA